METRTKSATINLLTTPKNKSRKSSILPRNTELAFSLSPASIAEKYEPNTASLQQKLQIIKQLLNQGYRVGLRFLPLIPVENYLIIYQELIDQVKDSIDINKIASIGIAPLIENKEERNADILTPFELLFKKNFPNANLFRDYQ
ncbi:hypothetical protein J5893_05340 [bacterium]|nr:hypothetical protein [bacterium]